MVSRERGSVLLLALGLVPVLAVAVAVITDVSVLAASRRALAAEVDSAVLAAAQSPDLAALYTGSGLTNLPLNCRAARSVVMNRLGGAGGDARVRRASLTSFRCQGGAVTITARSRVTLPFARHFGIEPNVDVEAMAAARSPFRS